MGFNLEEFYNSLTNGEVLVSFKGDITSEVINNALDTVEKKLESADEELKLLKKVYHILVEGLQNLYHHIEISSEDIIKEYGQKLGMFVVAKNEGAYTISLGNFVDEHQKDVLTEKIEKINSLSNEELKDLYKFVLNHQKLSAKGGGGLGLIDMAKKTKNKLDYKFHNYSNNWYFYNLNIKVS